MANRKWQRRGFTILELAVVNATVALLMTLAVPRLMRTINRSRAVEAVQTAATIERLMMDYYNRFGQYPPSPGLQNPPQPLSAGKLGWDESVAGWAALGFKGDTGSFRFRYRFETEADTSGRYTKAIIYAWADLDGNGINGDYTLTLLNGARISEDMLEE